MKGKRTKRLLTAMLAMLMVFTFMPQIAAPVYADGKTAAMIIGTSVLSTGCNTADAQTVYYGKDKNTDKPYAWRAIGYDGNTSSVAVTSGGITLWAAENYGTTIFDSSYSNVYKSSDLKQNVDAIANNGFTDDERSAIASRTLASGSYAGYNTDCVAGDEVKDALLWPLSTKEASLVHDKLREVETNDYLDYSLYWWLRSPGDDEGFHSSYVNCSGTVYWAGSNLVDRHMFGVRPAFNLNLQSILFTSAAEGGKSSGTIGALTQVGTNSNKEWKLTLLDDGSTNAVGKGHKGFTIITDKVTYNSSAKTVTVPYSGAATSSSGNEYISAIIKGSDGSIKYYGRIAEASAAADESVTISTEKMTDGDTMCVFNEQYNGEKKTDYSSALMTIPYQVVYDSDGGTGTMSSKGVHVGDIFTFPDCTFTPPKNKTFDHWEMSGVDSNSNNVDQNNQNVDGKFKVGDTVKIAGNCVQNGVITVTAHWKDAPPQPVAISGIPFTTLTAKDKNAMTVKWQKTNGVDGYDIFLSKCNYNGKKLKVQNVKTIEGNSTFEWTATGLEAHTPYKALVKAYVKNGNEKQYVASSPLMHAYTSNSTKKYTNAKSLSVKKKSVSIKKGKKSKIKAKLRKMKKGKKIMPSSHVRRVRYLSTNTSIATVTKKGTIKAKSKGTCYVYAYAHNGVFKKIKVTVK